MSQNISTKTCSTFGYRNLTRSDLQHIITAKAIKFSVVVIIICIISGKAIIYVIKSLCNDIYYLQYLLMPCEQLSAADSRRNKATNWTKHKTTKQTRVEKIIDAAHLPLNESGAGIYDDWRCTWSIKGPSRSLPSLLIYWRCQWT